MKYNQLSYIPTDTPNALQELKDLGFDLDLNLTDKENLQIFVSTALVNHYDKKLALANLLADDETNLLSFFQSDHSLTDQIFYRVALQLLGFVPYRDFTDVNRFISELAFPITYDNIIQNLHQLLATRTQTGNTLIDQLIAEHLIPITNQHRYFNGKALATFDTSQLIREVVYVETPVDSDRNGKTDLVKVSILRPTTNIKLPVLMTASPYHQGVNEPASDKMTHKMAGDLTVKVAGKIEVKQPDIQLHATSQPESYTDQAEETFTHVPSYTLNDYMLARGCASVYVSGIGTLNSDGFMTTGDYQQVIAYKSVIDWLNGRAIAYTSHKRQTAVKATWATGKVATTGISYLGTMSNALATTGVDGLELIIAEAGISSWYDYYRENGLIVSPGGYPGEDLDTLTEFTYSRNLLGGDYLRQNARYQKLLKEQSVAIDRKSGDYNQFWHDRNYVINAHKVRASVVFTHGTQDWNVKPINVFKMFKALPETVDKHLFLHHGAHVYMNNWQSIDFRETMNALITQKLLKQETHFSLPPVIWQDNRVEQTWEVLEDFGCQTYEHFELVATDTTISNHYEQETFHQYDKNFNAFKTDLLADKANSIAIQIPIKQEFLLNGRPKLSLKVKSSINKGMLSAQLLETGRKKYLQAIPTIKAARGLDNGRLFREEDLKELLIREANYRILSKGHLNLQNREDLLNINEVTPNEWLSVELDLQPTIYALDADSILKLHLYTTDFEHTIRDNSDYQLEVKDIQLSLPRET